MSDSHASGPDEPTSARIRELAAALAAAQKLADEHKQEQYAMAWALHLYMQGKTHQPDMQSVMREAREIATRLVKELYAAAHWEISQ